MKGNLSKKKGFLGDITEANLDYIASKIAGNLNTEYGERLDSAEDSIENLETTVKGKEDVSNKIMVAGESTEESQYFSAEATKEYVKEVDNATRAVLGQFIIDLGDRKADWGTELSDYRIKDAYTKKEIDTVTSEIKETAETALTIAKGASRAIAFENYQKFCEYILAEGMAFKENYPIGTTILIAKSGVPDLWYYEETDDYREVIPTDEEIARELENFGYFNIGYYKFAEAESSKMILDGYVQLSEFVDHSQDEDIHTTREEKEIWNAKLDKSNQNGGFVAGNYQEEEYAQDTSGVIIGKNAQGQQPGAISPVVIGEDAASNDGVAIGYNADSLSHGTSVGVNAIGGGVSIGHNAKAIGRHDVIIDGEIVESFENYPIDAIQLGKGTNKEEKTFQVYDFQLLDAEGNIPKERLKNAGGGGGSVDLSDYYTKTETKNEINTAIQSAIGDVLGGAS